MEHFHYSKKYARAVCLLAICGILLLPLGVLAGGTARIVLLCLAAALLLLGSWLRLRHLVCRGCGKSCAPLMVKKGDAPACPFCGARYIFDDTKG